jgi:molybdopterin-binding protein
MVYDGDSDPGSDSSLTIIDLAAGHEVHSVPTVHAVRTFRVRVGARAPKSQRVRSSQIEDASHACA